MRSVEEWIGKSDDTRPPERVRLRVLRRFGLRCHLTGRRIRPGDPWDCEHVVAIVDGGANRESNLAPALATAHKAKTAQEVARRARIDERAKSHFGIRPVGPARPIASRPMPTTLRMLRRVAGRDGRLPPPRGRALYRDDQPKENIHAKQC